MVWVYLGRIAPFLCNQAKNVFWSPATLIIKRLNRKLQHWLLQSRRTFALILCFFLRFLCFRIRIPYGTDMQTNRRTSTGKTHIILPVKCSHNKRSVVYLLWRLCVQIMFMPGVLTRTNFARPQSILRGGPLGELIQWSDLIAACYALCHSLAPRLRIPATASEYAYITTSLNSSTAIYYTCRIIIGQFCSDMYPSL